LIKDY
jgi:hypothetical protein